MEISLPVVNTTNYNLMRDRYGCGGGSYGLNVVFQSGTPYLIVFISDTDRYEDQSRDYTLFYAWQDQVRNKDGSLKPNPKPPAEFGAKLRNKTVVDALRWNGGSIPCITILKEGANRWAELYTDCVCRGVSVASDGAHYFRIERSRVPHWLLGPVIDDEDEE